MSWVNVYITGKPDFEGDAIHNLQKSGFSFLPGSSEPGLAMFWITDLAKFRDFKKAIGAKTIFKFRLHFFSSLEKYLESEHQKKLSLTAREEDMIREMNAWEESKKSVSA